MALSAEEFGRRLDAKPIATSRDRERYTRIDDLNYMISVRDRPVLLLPRSAESLLTVDELLVADERAPFWSAGKPDCDSVEPELSLDKQQTKVRDQLDRNTCVSFASLAALEHLLKPSDIDVNLSEQYANWLFMKLEGASQCREFLHTKRAATYLSTHGVCKESEWGYKKAASMKCELGGIMPPPNALRGATFGIADFRLIGSGLSGPRMGNTDYLECIISHGKTIVTALGIAIGKEKPSNEGYDVLNESGGRPLPSFGNHAMLLVGYDKPNRMLIFKNSWGTGKGDNGYVRLSYDYVSKYALYGFIIMSVNGNIPIRQDLHRLDLEALNIRLKGIERRIYRQPPGSKILVNLPPIERTSSSSGIVFKVRGVGEAIGEVQEGIISTDTLILPGVIEVKAGAGGLGHLLFTASSPDGRELPGIEPLVVRVVVNGG
jgi:Papain family cysteine protease